MRRLKCLVIALLVATILLIGSCSLNTPQYHRIKFNNRACISPHNRYTYITCCELKAEIDGHVLIVPRGFYTDLASIPKFYWPIMSPQYSGFVEPSILHDFLYRCYDKYTQREGDIIFYNALRQNGISNYTASKMYYAVRIFGHGSFHKSKNCEIGNNDGLSSKDNKTS